jgi:hypothetical protein
LKEASEDDGPFLNSIQNTLQFMTHQVTASAYLVIGDYSNSIAAYYHHAMKYTDCEVCQFGFWQHGIEYAKALYLAGHIQLAIDNSKQAMGKGKYPKGMGRFYENVSKFLVLGLFKLGKIDEARHEMEMAILHEAPWNKDHTKHLVALYKSVFGKNVESSVTKTIMEATARAPLVYQVQYKDVDFMSYNWYSKFYDSSANKDSIVFASEATAISEYMYETTKKAGAVTTDE